MSVKARLNDDQKEAFKSLQKFIEHPAADTFVLKGYAGTGKTFLMQYFAKWLEEKKYKFSLLASTGRAAAVLRGKSGLATKTVHRELYQFSKVDGAEADAGDELPIDQLGQMTLLFSLRAPDEARRIYIVDESSMLTNEMASDDPIVAFGSGNLLEDFFSAVKKNKIIFVGDPGQLPPVKQLFSPALEMEWLADQHRVAVSITLEKIERNEADNDILLFAASIRSMGQEKGLTRFPKLSVSGLNNVKLHPTDILLFKNYVTRFRETGPDSTIAIARSNRMVNDINRAVRRDLYGQVDLAVQKNDVLLVIHNNYSVPLANGDFVVLVEIGEISIRDQLRFQRVRLKALLSNTEYEILISLDILYGPETNFTKDQSRAIMVDFNSRMKKRNIHTNSIEYKEKMLKDPYLNCLRAKYGYAVTCHKAQGGEWNEVYLFLEKSMYAMPHSELFRWWYTAVTRARKELHLANNWWIQ